ncbi:Putative sterigmatocystin biosynthesis monooxygenase stcW [Psilocybe cubensis]|uniref:Sterigmatocystin biosynthesis monooxygenase stcW n=2 Tax=Psilocybe cubensis TaxID=181762 RepID=A0ACB8GVU5_PSICU|nr:Putative sterigmatocystin biosynthesis monooxygenase stcW [Psilocybe cubensis]KAH9479351.1 Putative sterigmatocystin biosynthesis monooxygenase stcW [Psilocybe cubensis]
MANDGTPALPQGSASDTQYRYSQPIHHERRLKVICIGAGASGLLLAYKLQRSFRNFELVIYEKNDDISGTWHENKYPGCACDVAAHIYTWSFEPNPHWSSVYSGSEEIQRYFQNFSKKYELEKYIKLKHQVSKATWDDKKGGWDVEIANLSNGNVIQDSCDILVNAAGVLNAWKWPDIPGLHKYKGELLHTARWDTTVDLNGKHVGLIGNGSSAIQVLPAISSQASKITTFIRGPTWVFPSQSIEQRAYSQEELTTFETNPDAHIEYRKELESSLNALFPMFIADSDVQKATFSATVATMKEKLQNDALEKIVIPSWAVGCRRMTPGINYLETLVSKKVDVVHGNITEITEKGCVGENGQEHAIDVLICATGFDTSYVPRFPIIGTQGDLREAWAKESKSYLGLAASGFPNYFMFIGPNSPIGNGPVLISIEAQADYICKLMDRWQTENIHSFSPKLEAVEDFIEHKDNFMKDTVWQQECRSWYKANSVTGKVTALWPGSTMHYLEAIAEPRYDDWDVKYNGNRFAFLGNGYSRTEVDTTADWAYYIRNHDDSPHLSRSKRRELYSKSGTIERAVERGAILL